MKKYKNEPAFNSSRKIQPCLARIRNGNGALCTLPAIPGKKRCFNHGSAPGSGAQPGNHNAKKHGYTTRENLLLRKKIKMALNEARDFLGFFAD